MFRNIFDFTLVNLWLAAELMQLFFGALLKPSILMILRLVRVARLVRIVNMSPGIKRILSTLALSLPALGNVGLLLFLIMYIYAVVGVQLFHKLAFGEFINEDANFTSFGRALLTLFRCITGESYNGLMHDSLVSEDMEPGRCSEADGTCGTWLAIPYHVSFQILAVHVVLQLVLAAILDTFSLQNDGTFSLTPDQLAAFRKSWADLDPEATGFIAAQELGNVVRRAPQPLGFGDADADDSDILKVMTRLKLKGIRSIDDSDFLGYRFHDVLAALAQDAQQRGGQFLQPTPRKDLSFSRVAQASVMQSALRWKARAKSNSMKNLL